MIVFLLQITLQLCLKKLHATHALSDGQVERKFPLTTTGCANLCHSALRTHHRMPHTTCHLPHYPKSYQRKTYVRVRRKRALARQLHLEPCSATRHKKRTTNLAFGKTYGLHFSEDQVGQPQVMRIYHCGK